MQKLKNGSKLLLFSCILCALLLLLSQLVVPKNNSKESGMVDARANGILAEPENTIDVVFVGDSECYSSFIPLHIWQETGITSYVCSTSAQRLNYSYEFLQKAFQKQSPRVVVLETNAIFRNISYTDVIGYKAEELFQVFRYHNRWKEVGSQDFNLKKPNYTYLSPTKGYKYNTKNRGKADTSKYMTPSADRQTIPPKCKLYLKKIAALCEKNGAKLVLVSTPSTKNWNTKRHNAVEDEAKDLNLTYLDLNLEQDQIGIDWAKDSRDKGDHLNYYGATKVTGFVATYLQNTKLFPDKRQNQSYKDWNQAAVDFAKKTQKKKK